MATGLEPFLPDDYTIEQSVRSFGEHILAFSAAHDPGDDVTLIFDRDVLMRTAAMLLKILNDKEQKS